jgi:hypothetical protein
MALATGAVVNTTHWIEYASAPIFQQFGRWALGVLTNDKLAYTSIQRMAVKHWTRALIGKCGAQYQKWVSMGPAPSNEVSLTHVWDADQRCNTKMLMAGGDAFWSVGTEYGQDSLPAVFSAVISETRIWLWSLMLAAGLENVLYCDTDGLIVTPTGNRALAKNQTLFPDIGARVKKEFESVWIGGPRQLILDGHTRWSGIPRKATQTNPQQWSGQRWESLAESLAQGNSDTVHITHTNWNPTPIDRRRVQVDGGKTIAREVHL